MAFQVPEHLPRRAQSQDKSTIILEEIAETSWDTLNATESRKWIEMLDAAIADTKTQLADRISEGVDDYRSTLESAQSVQEQVETLTTQVRQLTNALHEPEAGILADLQSELFAHQTLNQQVLNASIAYEAASFLATCNDHYDSIAELLATGRVIDGIFECQVLQQIFDGAPPVLDETLKFRELTEKLRAIETSAREQLYSASRNHVVVSRTFKGASFVVNQQVLFNGAKNPAQLETVFSNLNQPQLEQELEGLRENILIVILEPLTTSPFSYKLKEITDSEDVFELRMTTSPQSSNASPVLDDLRLFTCFLSERLLPHLPSTSPFTMQLRLNIARSLDSIILSKIVQKSLPHSLKGVPFCLQVADKAKEAEKLVNEKLTANEDAVSKWCDSIERWYEETRVEELLAVARDICETSPSGKLQIAAADQDATEEDQGGINQDQPGAEDNWEFDGNDTWGFDDEKGSSDTASKPSNGKDSSKAENDDDFGWGAWNDDDDEPETMAPSQPTKMVSKPKTASRLEKLSAKARTNQSPSSSQGSFSMQLPPPSPQSPFTEPAPIFMLSMLPPTQTRSSKKRDREVYTITLRATEILDHVEAVVQEASTLRDSNAFGKHSRPGKRGKLLFQTAPAACDMLRSFFPGMSQGRSSSEDIQLSCDFRYLSEKISAVYRTRAESSKGDFEAKEESKWEETVEGLRSASEMCLQNAIDNESHRLGQILTGARGFRDISDDLYFRRIDSAVASVFRELVGLARDWKPILTLTDYFNSMGSVADAILLQMVDEIVDLDDITEVESEKLADMCKKMEPVQNLFIDSNGESHVGTYVQSWFRFSYLKELLVASMADISYLFEQGMLLDYKEEEIIKLLKALFADTPLRENTIRKVLRGHPVLA